MTYIAQNTTTGFGSFSAGIVPHIAALHTRVTAAMGAAATRAKLAGLSDRDLKDIGLTRHDAQQVPTSHHAATSIHLRSCNW